MDIKNTNGAARRMLVHMSRGKKVTFDGDVFEILEDGWSMHIFRSDMKPFEDAGYVVLEIDNQLVLTPEGRKMVLEKLGRGIVS